jgi:uncharacterized protein
MTINISRNQIVKIIELVILVCILGILIWSTFIDDSSSNTQRTITESGQATIESEPDQYVFLPYYESSGTDQVAVQEDLNQKATEVTNKLKELGVEEKDIKLQSSAYENWFPDESGSATTTVSLEVTVSNKELSQKVQDYLITTGAKGQISPQGKFSEAKKKELDAQAREIASKEAKTKAEAQAAIFGAKVGDVIKIEQGNNNDIGYPMPITLDSGSAEMARDSTASSLPVLPGQNSYSASVSVTYELQ